MRPITSLARNPPELVSELMLHSIGDWNRELVHNVFIPFDAKAILSIPVCTRQVENFWAWGHNPKGIFSVRSAYQMLLTRKIRREAWLDGSGGSSNTKNEQRSWCQLWKIPVPSKIKVFLWRLTQQSILSHLLHHRNMATLFEIIVFERI